jgi:hypothetical protein
MAKTEFTLLDHIADTLEGMASGEGQSTASANTKVGMLSRIADALDIIAGTYDGPGWMVVHQDVEGKLDKTWREIRDALYAVVVFDNGTRVVTEAVSEISNGALYYGVTTASGVLYKTTTENGYPEFSED